MVDFILPVDKLPGELVKYLKAPYIKSANQVKTTSDNFNESIQTIFALIRKATGHDLSHYKQTTILRRIERRMAVHQVIKIPAYVKYLEENPDEVNLLFKDMLIGVTSFFRDPEAYKVLKEQVLPGLLKKRQPDAFIRIWIVGCSTGEEAYSLAILLLEAMDLIKQHFTIQVFASDIDVDAIEHARLGIYPESIAADVSPERLHKYFIKEDNAYRIKKQIREMIVFAVQNVIKDPPFSKIDLVSCRNLLIYMDAPLQKKLIPLFHYTLKSEGVLLLGTSESIGDFTDLFSPFNSKWKLFKKLEGVVEKAADNPILPFYATRTDNVSGTKAHINSDIQSAAEKLILSNYAPPGVIVNEHYEIIHFLGKTDKFLEMPVGKASFNLLSMAREGLGFKLGTALHNAMRQRKNFLYEAVEVTRNSEVQIIDLTVSPLLETGTPSGYLLVLFEEKTPAATSPKQQVKKQAKGRSGSSLTKFEQELEATKERLQTANEELETSNEELKSTNEELQSVNEELQSSNEELETSKEELQSTNEELVTVNAELQKKVEELAEANNDNNNLFASTEIGTIFLNTDLTIKRFTPMATKVFNLIVTDIGRPIRDITSNISFENLYQDMHLVLTTLEKKEKEIENNDGMWYSVRIIPYRTLDNVIDGIVITFVNISEIKKKEKLESEIDQRKKVEEALRQREEKYRVIFEGTSDLIVVTDAHARTRWANPAWEKMFGQNLKQQEHLFKLLHPDDLNRVTKAWETLIKEGKKVNSIVYRMILNEGKHVSIESSAYPVTIAGEQLFCLVSRVIGQDQAV
jgi:two-component system CheB/CheR fusion protein